MVDNASLRTVFFLGAGSSVKAGVNTTFGLVKEFENHVKNRNELSELLSQILDKLRTSNHDVDIEELLQTIDRLEKRDKDNIVKFYETTDLKLDGIKHLVNLKDTLKNFINQVTSVKSDKINYLEPLFTYPKPVLIFSVNYDTAIEQLCNVYKKTYTDGFDYSWNTKLFENNKLDFHLYKLHGSIMWYKTDRGDYLKLPLPPREGTIKLIFGEEAHHLMLYPMQKWDFDEPLLELMQQFRSYLQKAKTVVVSGYSFRDPYMVRIFHDVARKNRELIVILISPNAREIYENQLHYYEIEGNKSQIPSSLENRVLCLQYKFEDVLPIVTDYVSDVINGIDMEEKSLQRSYAGEDPNWYHLGSSLKHYINSEFIDKADTLIDKIEWVPEIAHDPFSVLEDSFKMFLVSTEQFRSSSSYWLELFIQSSYLVSLDRLQMSINFDSKQVYYAFKESNNTSRPFNALHTSLDRIMELTNRKKDIMPKYSFLYDLIVKLSKLRNFVRFRANDSKRILDIINETDENKYADSQLKNVIALYNAFKQNDTGNSRQNFEIAFKNLEISRLGEILGANDFHDFIDSYDNHDPHNEN